jgi:hypothetical protein
VTCGGEKFSTGTTKKHANQPLPTSSMRPNSERPPNVVGLGSSSYAPTRRAVRPISTVMHFVSQITLDTEFGLPRVKGYLKDWCQNGGRLANRLRLRAGNRPEGGIALNRFVERSSFNVIQLRV